jgi:FixJ family two-component response regulator
MPETNSHTPLISIVDDDESVREAIKSLLRSFGLSAEAFSSAEDFLSSRRLDDVICLIVDVVMPRMSGLDLQSRLMLSNRRIPLIFISAHDDADAKKRALEAGALAFLHKPFQEETLMQAVHSALARLDDTQLVDEEVVRFLARCKK